MPETKVSDHALRRYLERSKEIQNEVVSDHQALRDLAKQGVDLDKARDEIYRAVESGVLMGASAVKVGDCRFIIVEGTVVTVLYVDRNWNGGRARRYREKRPKTGRDRREKDNKSC